MSDSELSFPELIFPPAELRVRNTPQRTEIYDVFRKRWVFLSPEEWVRQNVLHYLRDTLNYPANRIAVEHSLVRNGKANRTDILVFDEQFEPWMIVECKEPNVKLSESTFQQAARYNLVIKAPYLVITNGLKLVAAQVMAAQTGYLPEMPAYPHG